MAYDFDRLKTVRCFDAVTIRVPERWKKCGPHHRAKGYWCCWEEGEETGTLWIKVNYLGRQCIAPGDGDFDPLRAVEDLARRTEPLEEVSYVRSVVSEVGGGPLWHCVFDGEEEGMPLRYFRYMHFRFRGDDAAFVHFSLVIPLFVIEDPEIRQLIDIMDREIREAGIDPFPAPPGDRGDFEPLKRVNFGDRVALALPHGLEAEWLTEPNRRESDCRWYCWFEPDDIEARMWVMTGDYPMADPETGEDVSVREDSRDGIIQQFLDDKVERRQTSLVRDGVLVHDVYDDDRSGETEKAGEAGGWRSGPLRRHAWRYFCFVRGTLRMAAFLLMLPLERAETPRLAALVRLLDREIPQADFPDLGASGDEPSPAARPS